MPDNPTQPAQADALPLFQVKCRWTGAVQFEGRFGSLRLCVEAAVNSGAYLARAKLAGAYLADAYLARAKLAGADLVGAKLAGANLAGADLAGANLAGANLAGADLVGADLADADLVGAYLAGAKLAGAKLRMTGGAIATLIGPLPIMQIGPLGSRAATLSICRTDAGLAAQTGCFGPAPLADFEAAVTATHGDNQHAQAYRAALALARVAMESAP